MTDHALHAFRAATARTCRPSGISSNRLKWILFLCGIWALATCSVFAQSQTSVNLVWDRSSASDISGYNIYYGVASQTYTNMVSVGNVTNALVPNLVPGVTYYFAATAVDSTGVESDFSNELSYNIPFAPSNTPPTISLIANLSVNAGTATPPLPFTVSDAQTPAANLTVSAACSNPALVPLGNIVLGGSGTNRTVTVTPASGQTGSATITLTVSDSSLSASTSFVLTVNPLPSVVLSSPANGATYSSPAAITMTASVAANGHTITSVQFYNGTALLGQTATAPYSFTWNAVSAGTYSLTAKAAYDAGATVLSPPVSVTVQGLPAPWQTVDIGAPGVAGSAAILNGLYTIKGAGNISGSADNFRFLYQGLSGDGEIRCECNSVQNAGSGGCLGAMVRESLTSGSRYAMMGMTSGGSFRWQRRSNTSGGTSTTKSGSAVPPNAWTRLVRTGNTLYGYKSTNGTNWTLVSSANISMATNIYIGLVVASGSTNALNTAVFTNVTVVP